MKKKIAFLMAVVMCGSMFTACGKDDESSSSGKKKEKASVTETAGEDDTDEEDEENESETKKRKSTEAETETDEDDEEETEQASGKKIKLPGKEEDETEEAAVNPAENVDDFKRGKTRNGVYTSEYSGLRFEVPDGWKCATEEEIFDMMNLAIDITGNEETINKDILEQSCIYELYAKGEGGKNVIIAYENLDVSSNLEGASELIDEEMYIENMKASLDKVVGVTYSELTDAEKTELAGQEFYTYSQKATYDSMGGYSVKQTYYIKKYGQLLLFIVFTSSHDCEDMSEYAENFSAL